MTTTGTTGLTLDLVGTFTFALNGAIGTIRDVMVRRIPTVLRSELYAVPALLGAAVAVVAARLDITPLVGALAGAAVCLIVRLLGVGFRLNAPSPPGTRHNGGRFND